MHHFLNIQETAIETGEQSLRKNQIRITNTSDCFINNLKLNISTPDFALLEQTIIRERGSLCYDCVLDSLDLGNLAPDETALFEYKYSTEGEKSLLSHLQISYTPDNAEDQIIESCTPSEPSNP